MRARGSAGSSWRRAYDASGRLGYPSVTDVSIAREQLDDRRDVVLESLVVGRGPQQDRDLARPAHHRQPAGPTMVGPRLPQRDDRRHHAAAARSPHLFGMHLVSAEPGRAEFHCDPDESAYNPHRRRAWRPRVHACSTVPSAAPPIRSLPEGHRLHVDRDSRSTTCGRSIADSGPLIGGRCRHQARPAGVRSPRAPSRTSTARSSRRRPAHCSSSPRVSTVERPPEQRAGTQVDVEVGDGVQAVVHVGEPGGRAAPARAGCRRGAGSRAAPCARRAAASGRGRPAG